MILQESAHPGRADRAEDGRWVIPNDSTNGERNRVRGAMAREHGDPSVVAIEEWEPAPLPPGGVRVAVRAAAVNFPDVLILANRYQLKLPTPFVPGSEFSGTVVEVADGVTGPAVGDEVFGISMVGAFATEVVVDAAQVTVLPAGADLRAAAAFGITYTTAYHALKTVADVQPGEWVVILGAGGGVGMAAIDCATVLGAKAVAVASSGTKRAACLEQGAVAALDANSPTLKEELKAVTGGGANVVIDSVGGDLAEVALRATTWGARFVVVGFASGEIPRIPLNLVLLKGAVIVGCELASLYAHHPLAAQHRDEVIARFVAGEFSPWIGASFDLEHTGDALRELAERRAIGKVLIDLGATDPAS